MLMTVMEIKHGLLAIAGLAAGLLVLVVLISGVHLLMREIAHSAPGKRKHRPTTPAPRKGGGKERLYAPAGD